jgi:hypothetical protein
VGIVYGKTYYVNDKGDIIGPYPTEPFDQERLALANFICQPSTFFEKKLWDSIEGLDITLRYTMDYDLWIRMSQQCKFLYLPEFLSTYRLHERSKTMSVPDVIVNHEECLRTVMKYYGWAPLNRLYGYWYHKIKNGLPSYLGHIKVVVVFLSVLFTVIKYFQINKTVKHGDLRMLTRSNIRKLFKDWSGIPGDS